MQDATKLLYLDDPNLGEADAIVLASECIAGKASGLSIVLDQTIFFPKSGGQPSDVGIIRGASKDFRVEQVNIESHVVRHAGVMQSGTLAEGDKVRLSIDPARRRLHTRLHSAGELICAAMRNIGYADWLVSAANHYPGQAKVAYRAVPSDTRRAELPRQLKEELDRLVKLNERVRIDWVNEIEVAEKLCGFRPNYLPPGEAIRIVTMSGALGRPCVGTHVSFAGEVGNINIRGVRVKGGQTFIGYDVD